MKMKKQFCTYCMDYRECEFQEKNKKEKIDNIEIEYLEKCYICKTCGEKIYGDLLDYNTIEANNKLREQTGIIQVSEIEEILNKYNIGKKPLSLVLGLGEITITRYLDGQNPTRDNSELLKNILRNPILYEMYLEVNKDNTYITKGDANNGKDNWTVNNRMIKGKVGFYIKYVGWPTVKLSEYLEEGS